VNPSIRADLAERDLLEAAERSASARGTTVEEMLSRGRTPHLAAARADFYAYLAGSLGWSPGAIGRLVGRDRSSVAQALAKLAGSPPMAPPHDLPPAMLDVLG
jgi:hypothetical protein